jgi:Flp pilus assembly protein TadD
VTSGSGATSGTGTGGARGGSSATSAGLGLGGRGGLDLAASGSSEPSGSDGSGALAKARDNAEAAEAARAAAAAAVAAQSSAKQLADIAARSEGPVSVALAEAAQGAVRISAESAQQAADAAAEARNPATTQLALAKAVVRAQKGAARAKEAAEEASDDIQQVVTAAPGAPRPGWLARARQNSEAQAAFETGKARYEAHDLLGARRHLENAVRLNPELDDARALLGWAEFFSGATRASTVTFKTTLRRQPTWEGLYNGLGWSRLRLNRPHLARDAFRAALDANPAYTDAMAGWGLALYELDEYAAAIPALDQATATLEASLGRDAPELVDLREALAWSLYRTGRFGEAAVEFERVIKARPNGSEPQAALGWSYLRMGRRGDARAAFLRALELAPNSPDAARGLSQASAAP